MEINAVGVSATDLSRAIAFYELLGFRFPPLEPETVHIEAEGAVALMIDDAAFLTELHGEPPRPGNIAAFAAQCASPADVDETVRRVASAGHTVVAQPYDAAWGQRYATVADPDGFRVDLYAPLR
jgi:catechol 2,3-dioxygenase-like lactoylglutathione lyase family enzyme